MRKDGKGGIVSDAEVANVIAMSSDDRYNFALTV